MENRAFIISTASFGLFILLFLLPFISIECGNQPLANATGFELATGFSVRSSMDLPTSFGSGTSKTEDAKPNIYAILALLSCIIGLVLSIVFRNTFSNLKISAIACAAASCLLLIFMQVTMQSNIPSEVKQFSIAISFKIGYWLSVILPVIFSIVMLVLPKPYDIKTNPFESQNMYQ